MPSISVLGAFVALFHAIYVISTPASYFENPPIHRSSSDNIAQTRQVSSGFNYTGTATFYAQDGVGDCGRVSANSDFVVSLQIETYDNGANCNRLIQIERISTGKSITAQVVDECVTCGDNPGSLDLSLGAFTALGTLPEGEFEVEWKFID